MYISLNWIRDFVDLPADIDSQELALKLTMVTAEVEGIEQINVHAKGLVAAEVLASKALPGTKALWRVELTTVNQQYTTITAATDITPGCRVIYAPPGATLPGIGQIRSTTVGDETSEGMIIPGEMIGMLQAEQKAIFLPPSVEVGSAIDTAELDDWVIEIDNKAVTHRPDLWGLYGFARELAAIYNTTLKPYDQFVLPADTMTDASKSEIPIVIDAPDKCPRYTGLMIDGLRHHPAPLWMQARLSHVGVRPIDLIVDLTNYIMIELGQPMHAFDGARIDRIEVAVAKPGETFTTLDNVTRTLPEGALMIQSNRRSVALAGIMGGLDTEVTAETTRVLLESANFEPTTIRRCAAAMGHRTEASARFEKSLDPLNTVLGIGRFVKLAQTEIGNVTLASTLSDAFPKQPEPVSVNVDLQFLDRFMGRHVEPDQVRGILTAIGFGVEAIGGDTIRVDVPSYRATRDVAIEADVIEEVARFVGYENVEPRLPHVALRNFEPNALQRLQRRSLELLTGAMGFCEIQNYVWFDTAWLATLGFDPGQCVQLRNPPAAGFESLRTTLGPDMLAAAERNRHNLEAFNIVELGSVFYPRPDGDTYGLEQCHIGLTSVLRGVKKTEDRCFEQIKAAVDTWAQKVLGHRPTFTPNTRPNPLPWQHAHKTAEVVVAGKRVGYVTVAPDTLKGRIHDHLRRSSIAIAELNLHDALDVPTSVSPLPDVPAHPQVRLDFSLLAEADRPYVEIAEMLNSFEHPLLSRLTFLGSYQGKPLPDDKRSLTLRATIGHGDKTLTDEQRRDVETRFTAFLTENGLELRA